MGRAAGVRLQSAAQSRQDPVEVHRSPDAEVHQIRDALQIQAVHRVRPDRQFRPLACVSDASGGVRRGTGRVLMDRCVAGSRQALPADDGQRSACRAVCLPRRRMCPSELQSRAGEPEPCTRAWGRSAASPCGAQVAPEEPKALASSLQRLPERALPLPQQRQELEGRQELRVRPALQPALPAQQRPAFQPAFQA